jgi:tetratricopeptide (TPR) repeat protein
LCIVAVVLIIVAPGDKPVAQIAVTQKAAATTARVSEQSAVQQSAARAQAPDPSTELAHKVAGLEAAGNWNVQVLYAGEWTRKYPENATAWNRLAAGYLQMGQMDEALEAAQRAVKLSPDTARHWSGLARVALALQRLPEARNALERALAIDADDMDALCGTMTLAADEGRRKDAEAVAVRLGPRAARCTRDDDNARPATVDAASVVRYGTGAKR